MMHVLLIHQAFASLEEPGGTRHYELARYLARRGHQITVIASSVSYLTGVLSVTASEDEGRIRVWRAYTYPALHRSFIHRTLAFLSFMFSSFVAGLRVRDVDLVWGTSPPIFQGVTAWALARLKGVPFLFEVRDLWPTFAVAIGVLKNPCLIRLSVWLERFLYRQADQVVVNSPGYVAHVAERGARQVVVVPNGADPAMFDPDSDGASFRARYALQDSFVILYAGAHGLSNDLDTVLEAAFLLRAEEHIKLVLLGDGKEKPRLQERAQAMGLQNVLFLPPAPKSEMPLALAAADACLAILKPLEEYKTTYPNKVFDYMAAGRPIVLAIDGVIREVVEKAGCGIFVPPGNPSALAEAVRKLAADKANARRMGLRGRHDLESHFSRPALAEQLLQVMEATVR